MQSKEAALQSDANIVIIIRRSYCFDTCRMDNYIILQFRLRFARGWRSVRSDRGGNGGLCNKWRRHISADTTCTRCSGFLVAFNYCFESSVHEYDRWDYQNSYKESWDEILEHGIYPIVKEVSFLQNVNRSGRCFVLEGECEGWNECNA